MTILFEEYLYEGLDSSLLKGLPTPVKLGSGGVKFPYVGYYCDAAAGETIFILPKVFIVEGRALGRYPVEELFRISHEDKERLLAPPDRFFLFELSAWLYQAIVLFNKRHADNDVTFQKENVKIEGRRGKGMVTLLDHVLALWHFNNTHQMLFTHVMTLSHSRRHKIEWTKTVRTVSPLLYKKTPYYLESQSKEKRVNYDEELICLFYSTLEYLRHHYCFAIKRSLNCETEKPHRIAQWIKTGQGTRRLRQIRGKYFSDELVQLWRLLYAFYERAEAVAQGKVEDEYLLVSAFNNVFEDMIDCLLGESSLPKGLKEQKDGKIIDHIYRDRSLVEASPIYFIGDSKYYREGGRIGATAKYKQYTYSRNVIQFHIDRRGVKDTLRYRDELTEGYNPTPNFLIRGFVDPEALSYGESKLRYTPPVDINVHFDNRLFDRDTLLLLSYDINILYVLATYVQLCGGKKRADNFLRLQIRSSIISVYEREYVFFEVMPRESYEAFVIRNFKLLNGKIYRTAQGRLLLALKKVRDRETGDRDVKESIAIKKLVTGQAAVKEISLLELT